MLGQNSQMEVSIIFYPVLDWRHIPHTLLFKIAASSRDQGMKWSLEADCLGLGFVYYSPWAGHSGFPFGLVVVYKLWQTCCILHGCARRNWEVLRAEPTGCLLELQTQDTLKRQQQMPARLSKSSFRNTWLWKKKDVNKTGGTITRRKQHFFFFAGSWSCDL